MFQLFSQGSKRKSLGFSHSLHLCCTIGHDTRNFRHFSKPAAIIFKFSFKCQVHGPSLAQQRGIYYCNCLGSIQCQSGARFSSVTLKKSAILVLNQLRASDLFSTVRPNQNPAFGPVLAHQEDHEACHHGGSKCKPPHFGVPGEEVEEVAAEEGAYGSARAWPPEMRPMASPMIFRPRWDAARLAVGGTVE